MDTAGLSHVEDDFLARKAPIVGAAREMARATPERIVPGTMLNAAGVPVAGFEFSRGGAVLYSLVRDADDGGTFTPPWPDDAGYAWQNDLEDPTAFADVFTEAQQIEAWNASGWRLQHAMANRFLGRPGPGTPVTLRPRLLTVATAAMIFSGAARGRKHAAGRGWSVP